MSDEYKGTTSVGSDRNPDPDALLEHELRVVEGLGSQQDDYTIAREMRRRYRNIPEGHKYYGRKAHWDKKLSDAAYNLGRN